MSFAPSTVLSRSASSATSSPAWPSEMIVCRRSPCSVASRSMGLGAYMPRIGRVRRRPAVAPTGERAGHELDDRVAHERRLDAADLVRLDLTLPSSMLIVIRAPSSVSSTLSTRPIGKPAAPHGRVRAPRRAPGRPASSPGTAAERQRARSRCSTGSACCAMQHRGEDHDADAELFGAFVHVGAVSCQLSAVSQKSSDAIVRSG